MILTFFFSKSVKLFFDMPGFYEATRIATSCDLRKLTDFRVFLRIIKSDTSVLCLFTERMFLCLDIILRKTPLHSHAEEKIDNFLQTNFCTWSVLIFFYHGLLWIQKCVYRTENYFRASADFVSYFCVFSKGHSLFI
jgi:hypothetical protein